MLLKNKKNWNIVLETMYSIIWKLKSCSFQNNIIFSCLTCALRSSVGNTLISIHSIYFKNKEHSVSSMMLFKSCEWKQNMDTSWFPEPFYTIHHIPFFKILLGFIMHAILLQDHMPNSSLCWILSDMDSETLELLLVCAPWSRVLVLLQIEWWGHRC